MFIAPSVSNSRAPLGVPCSLNHNSMRCQITLLKECGRDCVCGYKYCTPDGATPHPSFLLFYFIRLYFFNAATTRSPGKPNSLMPSTPVIVSAASIAFTTASSVASIVA